MEWVFFAALKKNVIFSFSIIFSCYIEGDYLYAYVLTEK